jgi:hypothetical protein
MKRPLGLLLVFSLLLTSCTKKKEGTAYEPLSDRSCVPRYKKLYGDSELKISVFFGYKDSRPQRFVGDRYERSQLVQRVLRKCSKGVPQPCGFQRDPEDLNRFYREIKTPWGQVKSVILTVMDSSLSADDQYNRRASLQEWKSKDTKRAFHDALINSHVVLYNGHSRTGGGPDFYPPQINSKGKVLYEHYRTAQQGFMDMLEVLGRGALLARSQLVGLFSCQSSHYFTEAVRKERPGMALIGSSSLIYYKDALENTAETIGALLDMECRENFRRRLKENDPLKGSVLEHFFDS